MSESTSGKLETQSRSTWRMAVPLVLFMGLTGLFYVGLFSGDPSKLPSALIGKKVPAFNLPPLDGLVRKGVKVEGISSSDLAMRRISIVNVWASWCIPCRAEHPFLVQLAEQSKAPLFGINYKDGTAGARRFLGRYGNPFVAVGVDAKGATAIDWGVYGIPETFIVGGDGTILYKHVGPIDAGVIKKTLLPVIEKARSGS